MITFISFALIIIGGLNWLSIGALQYDFIAGLFGSQASMFSRIIYFFVGVAGVWLIIQAIRGKGKIKINDDGFDKKKDMISRKEHEENYINRRSQNNYEISNAEAGKDYVNDYQDRNRYMHMESKNSAEYINRGFPRDYSRYNEDYQERKIDNEYQTVNKIDYKSLGYKDFNEEDLD